MFVMMVVTISPVIEWEMYIHSDNLTHDSVGVNWREEGEVSHVVELDEEANNVEGVQSPS